MILELRQMFNLVGDRKTIDYTVSADELKEISDNFVTPIAITGTIVNRAGVVTLSFSCKFTMKLICDRCLSDFNREYEFSFEHTLVQSSTNDDYVVCENNTLDLNELAISDLLLQLPTKILCREDCKGLCMKCGSDLNLGECRCSKSE